MTTTSPVVALRFTVKPLGPARTERQLRTDVEAAFAEALADIGARDNTIQVPVQVSIEPEGGFLAGGVELWALAAAAKPVALAGLKLAAGAAAAAVGKKAGESVWEAFAARLKKRNILVEQASDAAEGSARPGRNNEKKLRGGSRKKTTRK